MRKSISVAFFSTVATLLILGVAVMGLSQPTWPPAPPPMSGTAWKMRTARTPSWAPVWKPSWARWT